MTVDVATESAAVTADLRALAPNLTSVPVIKTSRPFYGAGVGDLRPGCGPGRPCSTTGRPPTSWA